MSFRRQRDDWDELLSRHREELRECGIPDEILSHKLRFFAFLEHGFDDWERKTNPHELFHSKHMTNEQIEKFAEFVERHIDPDYGEIVSQWKQGGPGR